MDDQSATDQKQLALTADNLVTILTGVEDKWKEIGETLIIPNSEIIKIDDEQYSSAKEKLRAVFKYGLEIHPYSSWRLIIRSLDKAKEYEQADKIRTFAETMNDQTLTLDEVSKVFLLTKGDWNENLGIALLIPKNIRDKIKQDHSDLGAQKRALMEYWIQTMYNVSWGTLAGVLYYTQEEEALRECKYFLPTNNDDSPSLEDLEQAFTDITDWNGLGRCLRLHRSIREDIKKTYSSDVEKKTAVLKHYIEYHPAPNLLEAAWSLYLGSGENFDNPETVKQQKSLQELYVKRHLPAPLSEDYHLLSSFNKAIDDNGVLIQTVMQAILHGNAGFGKTSLIKSLLGLKPSTSTTSTGVMEEPKRIELSTVSVDGSDSGIHWTHIEDLQEETALLVRTVNSDQINSYLTQEEQKRRIITEAKEYENDSIEFDMHTVPGILEFREYTMNKRKRNSGQQPSGPNQQAKGELKQAFLSALKKSQTKINNEDPWTLYISDIGGQLEFQELIPALTSGPCLHFIVIAAHIGLNNKCPVVYHNKHGSTTPYKSSHTLKENVLQQLSTVMSTGRNDQQPKIMFFLTFIDQLETHDEIAQLDEELKQAVKPTDAYKSGAIEMAETKTLCHFIDNTNPREEDLYRIRKTVERIGKRDGPGSTYKVLTPCSWLQFGIALRLTNSPVLKFDDCVQIGYQCNIQSESEVKAALYFLHQKVGLIRYFVDVIELNDIVIVEPKILFSNVTRLVEDTFTIETVSSVKQEMFSTKGIFSKDMIRKIITGSEHLTRKKLIAFLKHYHILAEMDTNNFFLPCSLVHAEPQMKEKRRKSTIPPLLIAYSTGYVPRGVFGFTVAELITNKSNNLTLEEDNIYRDQVTLQFGPYESEVCLMSYPAYIQIDVFPNHPETFSVAKTCCKVKSQVLASLQIVMSKLNYNEKNQPYFAFECVFCEVVHPARYYVHEGQDGITCSVLSKSSFPPPEGYKLWIEDPACRLIKRKLSIGDGKNEKATKKIKLDELEPELHINLDSISQESLLSNLSDVLEILYDLESKWRLLGESLNISGSVLDSIASDFANNRDCFPQVVIKWLRQDSKDPPLKVLNYALESHALLRKHIAQVNKLACKFSN